MERWVTKLSLGDQSLLMTARLRRAWAATKVYYQQIEQDGSKVALADLDSMLEEGELRDAKTAFWLRYKMRFPAEVHPADAVVSRVARELSKRVLCVYNVWKVRSLQFQMGSSQKRRKVGEGLFTAEADHDEAFNMDVDTYLAKLQTLMIAYALAGTAPLTGVPDPKAENVLGANSTEFVEVPLPTFSGPARQPSPCLRTNACHGSKRGTQRSVQNGFPSSGKVPSHWGP